eukprot:3718049-Rhodomonas_salina.1
MADCNRIMGAIDDFDQLLAFFSVRLQGKKWWHCLFYFISDVVQINGFFLWNWDNAPEDDYQQIAHRKWVVLLIKQIRVLSEFGDCSDDMCQEDQSLHSSCPISAKQERVGRDAKLVGGCVDGRVHHTVRAWGACDSIC